MGSPEFKSDSEPIEPTGKSSPEQEHVSTSMQNNTGVTRREMLSTALRAAAVLGAAGTGISNAAEPAQNPNGKQVNTDTSGQLERKIHNYRIKAIMNAYDEEYPNYTYKEISDLINQCVNGQEDIHEALSVLADKRIKREDFVKDIDVAINKLKVKFGDIQYDLKLLIKTAIGQRAPTEKAAFLSLAIEQAIRVGDDKMVNQLIGYFSTVKTVDGIGLSAMDILRIKVIATKGAMTTTKKMGESITMSVETRLNRVRLILDNDIPQALAAGKPSLAKTAKETGVRYIYSIGRSDPEATKKLSTELRAAYIKIRYLENIENAYRRSLDPKTGKIEKDSSHAAAARWLMETGHWEQGMTHLIADKSDNSRSASAARAANLDITATKYGKASDLIKASNAWIYAGKSNLSNNKLYLRRVAELAGRLKCMKGLKFEEDAAIGKIMQHLKRNGIGAIASTTKPKEAFPKGEWVSLLEEGVMKNVKKSGPEWSADSNRIVVKDPVGCSKLLFDIPPEVLENGYEIEYTLERVGGVQGIYIPIGGNTGHTTLLHCDSNTMGLDRIGHKRFNENETTIRVSPTAGNKIKIIVKPSGKFWNITVMVNSKIVIDCTKSITEFDLNEDWRIEQPVSKEAPKHMGFIGHGQKVTSYSDPRIRRK